MIKLDNTNTEQEICILKPCKEAGLPPKQYYTKPESDKRFQHKLVCGENIKTINGECVLGSGDINIKTDLSDYYTKLESDSLFALNEDLVSIENQVIKNTSDIVNLSTDRDSINNELGSIKDSIDEINSEFDNYPTKDDLDVEVSSINNDISNLNSLIDTKVSEDEYNAFKAQINNDLSNKQDALINQVNIKSINGESILGSGNIEIEVDSVPYLVVDNINNSWYGPSGTSNVDDFNSVSGAITNGSPFNIYWTDGTITTVLDEIRFASITIIECCFHTEGSSHMLIQSNIMLNGRSVSQFITKNYVEENNLKTINGESITGSGDITIDSPDLSNYVTKDEINTLSDTVNKLSGEVTNNQTNITELQETIKEDGNKIDNLDKEMSSKQDTLISGSNIKTINGESVLGAGNIDTTQDLSGFATKEEISKLATKQDLSNKQDVLVSGQNISTINGISLLTGGDIIISSESGTTDYNELINKPSINGEELIGNIVIDIPDISNLATKTELANKQDKGDYAIKSDVDNLSSELNEISGEVALLETDKQDKLISGTNIKTINGESILGGGNITVTGDLSDYYTKNEIEDKLYYKQDLLISGTNIATINGTDLLQGGNLDITPIPYLFIDFQYQSHFGDYYGVKYALENRQPYLIYAFNNNDSYVYLADNAYTDGTNIKVYFHYEDPNNHKRIYAELNETGIIGWSDEDINYAEVQQVNNNTEEINQLKQRVSELETVIGEINSRLTKING